MSGFERETFSAAWHAKRVWAAQFVGNVATFAIFYGWLHIPDAHVWQLLLTAIVAIAGLLSFFWLHSSTLGYFEEARATGDQMARVIRSALRHVPAMLLALAIFACLEWLLSRAQPYAPQTAGYLQHTLPRAARAHTTPQSVLGVGQVVVWVLQYFVVPPLFLPLLSSASARGFRSFRSADWLRRAFHWRWVIFYAVALGIGWFLPVYLANKVIKASGVAAQTTSFAARLLLAYLLAVTAWVCVASALGRLLAPPTEEAAASATHETGAS